MASLDSAIILQAILQAITGDEVEESTWWGEDAADDAARTRETVRMAGSTADQGCRSIPTRSVHKM